jgi:NTP pyrophosphatase (non-canonical NTP hydrolase)
MSLDDLVTEIKVWGYDKGILPAPDPIAQFSKTLEEVEELAIGIDKKDEDEIRDAIGDIFVTLVMQTQAWHLSMQECVEAAYNEIKGRTGKMEDGVFVKDA